ncbi:response regulator [Thioclava sp. IC9]|uniref:response regulator n=1 Tax=Thioclava sp. IC9 TaxID=1973007 RepID=UPI000B543C58|nr:response regulator [Thioclava sp. IC9]OWY00803.1 hypothetical protein B6V76_15160 [Thioclava sp. IC9]
MLQSSISCLEGSNVLVVEDELFIAYDIAFSVEEAGGQVAGPFATLARARATLTDDSVSVDGAILDMNLLDGSAEALIVELWKREVPLVVNTAEQLPLAFQSIMPEIPVFSKPTNPWELAEALGRQLRN